MVKLEGGSCKGVQKVSETEEEWSCEGFEQDILDGVHKLGD